MRAALLAILAACSPTAWRHGLTIEADSALLCDYGETRAMSNDYRWSSGVYETNPMLGRHPSDLATASYLGAVAILVAVAHDKLPNRYAIPLLAAFDVVETANVLTNVNRTCGL